MVMFRKLQQKNSRRHVVCVPATHHWVDHRRWQNLARRRDLTVNIIFEHRNKHFVSLAYTKSEKTNLLFCPSLRSGCIFVQLFLLHLHPSPCQPADDAADNSSVDIAPQ